MKWWQLVLIVVGIVAAIILLTLVYIKCRKKPIGFKKAIVCVLVIWGLMAATTITGRLTGILATKFSNPTDANKNYGFAYCFSCTLFDRGIDKPKDYSPEVIENLANVLESQTTQADLKVKPNIIFLQLESFIDVKRMNDISCSENPTPNYDALMKKYPSGYLTVPSIGAGTANTEFEVISGMSLAHFGTGEYPYKTILKKTGCSSVCYSLKNYGYSAHAIHNNSGTFYDRNLVFSSLGFDTFTSIEYMENVVRNDVGWAKDSMLTDEIVKVLDSTENRDVVYAISVQAHGKYPTEYTPKEGDITVSGLNNDEERIASFNYYVNQVHEVDEFIGELVATLEKYDEPTLLVMYGDHLPTLDIEDTELNDSNLFQTEYVIWNNFGFKADDCDLYAYQLNAYIMEKFGINGGLLTTLHQTKRNSPNYQNELKLLEYDILYGDKIAYGGVDFFAKTELQMGTDKISITGITQAEDGVYIKGENFTGFSYAIIDDEKQETTFIDKNTLFVKDYVLVKGNEIHISQIGKDKEVLSSTQSYIVS